MQVINKEAPSIKKKFTATLRGLKADVEACVMPRSEKNKVYATISRLKNEGYDFITQTDEHNIFIWRKDTSKAE